MEIPFAATEEVPLDAPIPLGVAILSVAEGLAAIARADPLWSAKVPVWVGGTREPV